MTRVACLAVALAVAVPLAGCGGSDAGAPATAAPVATAPPEATAPPITTAAPAAAVTAADLIGRTFLIDAERSDGDLQPTAQGEPVVLTFGDRALGVQPGCNSAAGTWAVVDGRLEFAAGGSTEMLCAGLMEQDDWVLDVLGSQPEITLGDGTIELRTRDATLRGRDERTVVATRPLTGPVWAIVGTVDAAGGQRGAAGTTARFRDDGRLHVTTGGCGPLDGRYEVADGELRVTLDPHPPAQCEIPVLREQAQLISAALGSPLAVLERGIYVRLTAPDGSAIVLSR